MDELEQAIYDELLRLGDTAGEAEIDLEEILYKIDLDMNGGTESGYRCSRLRIKTKKK